MKTIIHAAAGGIAFLTILVFWTSTISVELFATYETIAAVKALILTGMFILIPAMAIVGATGMMLGGKRVDPEAVAKKKRMPIIAANGFLILIPAAFYLESKASIGVFDLPFYGVQVLELLAGATNLMLLGKNIRDGLRMTGRMGNATPKSPVIAGPTIEERNGGPLVVKGISHIEDAQGDKHAVKPVVALCRCGASKTKPYCDGSHNALGFDSRPSEDRTPDMLQVFEGADISIHYNRLLCSHAGECGEQLKSVFDPSRKPWIVPDNGTASEVIDVVKACPSGALSYSLSGQKAVHAVSGVSGVIVEKDGPFRVVDIPLLTERLAIGASSQKYALCRCGASKNKPYCDGTHHDIGWSDD